MKKILFILFATFSLVANAKNAVPQSVTKITPLSIGEENSNFILEAFGNNGLLYSNEVLVNEFEIGFEAPENYKSVINVPFKPLLT